MKFVICSGSVSIISNGFGVSCDSLAIIIDGALVLLFAKAFIAELYEK